MAAPTVYALLSRDEAALGSDPHRARQLTPVPPRHLRLPVGHRGSPARGAAAPGPAGGRARCAGQACTWRSCPSIREKASNNAGLFSVSHDESSVGSILFKPGLKVALSEAQGLAYAMRTQPPVTPSSL
jgi:hypothetical protein